MLTNIHWLIDSWQKSQYFDWVDIFTRSWLVIQTNTYAINHAIHNIIFRFLTYKDIGIVWKWNAKYYFQLANFQQLQYVGGIDRPRKEINCIPQMNLDNLCPLLIPYKNSYGRFARVLFQPTYSRYQLRKIRREIQILHPVHNSSDIYSTHRLFTSSSCSNRCVWCRI